MFAAKKHSAALTVVQKTWLSHPETTCCQRSPLSATALMPCGIGRPTWAVLAFLRSQKRPNIPFLPQSWKWKTSPNERKLLLKGIIFHWTMIMGGRADPPKMGLENMFRFHLLNLGTRGTPRKSNDIKHDKPYERAHKNHSSPPSEVHVRNFYDDPETRVS